MIVRACAFTTKGWELISELSERLPEIVFETKESEMNLDEWIRTGFEYKAPILFVGAVGIAIRKIAPFIENKLSDSPVIVVGEDGRFVVPILSDHVGCAGELAARIAKATGGQNVVTTATDIRNTFSIDVFAVKNGLKITDKNGIKKVSSKLLETGCIRMEINPQIEYDVTQLPQGIQIVDYENSNIEETDNAYENDNVSNRADVIIETMDSFTEAVLDKASLVLIYKPFVLGSGCKKNTDLGSYDRFVNDILTENGIDISMVASMASIDLKKSERALLYFETRNRILLTLYSAEELEAVEGNFTESEFVKSVTGVSNVCERAAIKHAGEGASLIVRKTAKDGMTLAVSKRKARIVTWET